MNWTIDILFFFVYAELLKLFAFSLLIMNVTKVHKKWIKYPIVVIYLLYTVLKITEIKNWVVSGNFAEFLSVVPFFCMLLLPAIAKNTQIGKYLLSYFAICFYYAIFNAIWLYLNPTEGQFIATMVYALLMFVIGQSFEIIGEGAQKK